MYALVITPKCQTPQYVPLNLAMESLQSAYTILSDTSLTDLQKTERMYGDESMLYDALWQPLETYFNGAKSIYFSPTGPLNLICFHALRVNVSTYLTDRYDLHQLTNTALLAERNKLSSNMSLGRRAKVYGAIYYNKAQELSHAKLTHLREEYTFLSEPLYADNRAVLGDVFPFLQNTLYEADGIHHTLTAMGVNSSEEIGFTPTESAIRSLNGHSPEILHISTHGFFYNSLEEVRDIPYFKKGGELNAMTCSGLALANADDAWLGLSEADSKDDNILTSAEVSELDLRNTQLVVLSACQTGLGSVGADGVFGLQRGFKQAGVESICASLWSVADKSTAEMMQLFYKYWMSEKMTIHTAMKRAMKEQRHTTPSPYYWAPFVLIDAIE
jgi:CHAT domain-containing protein